LAFYLHFAESELENAHYWLIGCLALAREDNRWRSKYK
jgi:hypothetical protein